MPRTPLDQDQRIKVSPARPFLKWAGGKGQLLPELIKRVPETYARYFEPFIGGGALFFALEPESAFLSDINPDLVNVYRVVKKDVEKLIKSLEKHYYCKDYFYEMRRADRTSTYSAWGDVRKASRLIFLNKTCFNGLYRVNSKGHFNVPFGNYKNPKILDEPNLLACSRVLQNAEITVDSFETVELKAEKGDFVYFDPPYVPLNVTSSFTSYSKEGFDTDRQLQLRDVCERLDQKGVKFMLSNSSAPLILELYQAFNLSLVRASRSINSKGNCRGKIAEVIVTNYDLP
ncbi:DNA adenine methylase [Lyngbya confervoides]|uniref:Site-specific DNA-methyltransferase (adenine-specific) n=1 Tax=Lyngbya confervoides BDU141951 TaxID=1574623 RepID=A0ABD4T5A1_9CYAN|nr:DNA adenine methylase [Lyngbya confervoides]MCM1983735.1 DNA adenine methylase [Lyngbya confervoides BDU141951]